METLYRVKIMNGMAFVELGNDYEGFSHIAKDSITMHLYTQKRNDYGQRSLHNGLTVRPYGHEPVALSSRTR